MKTHVGGFFDTDLHKVSWHFATHEAVLKAEWVLSSTDRVKISVKEAIQNGFLFIIPHLKSKCSQSIVSNLFRQSAISPRPSSWRLIVLVRSLRSSRLDTAWLVKGVTYFNLIGSIGGCVREFQRSKYKFSSHPKTLELTGKCGVSIQN